MSETPLPYFSLGVQLASLNPGVTVGDVLQWDGTDWISSPPGSFPVPLCFFDVVPPPAAPGDITKGLLYKKAGLNGLFWLTDGGGEVDLVAGGGGVVYPLLAPDGSAAAPSYSFTASPGAGMFSLGVDELDLGTAGVGRIHMDAIGNIGFGTATPTLLGGFVALPFADRVLNIENLGGSQFVNITGSAIGGPSAVLSFTNPIAALDEKIAALALSGNSISVYSVSDAGVPFANPLYIGRESDYNVTMGGPSSSALTVNSTTRGFIAPRMTTLERDAIVGPEAGLMIYNTDTNVFNYYDGVAWTIIGGGTFPLLASDGSSAAPSYSFSGGADTGMYIVPGAPDSLRFASDSTDRMLISSTDISVSVPVRANAGAVGLPSYSFNGDNNTGIYHPSADQIGISTGGSERIRIDGSGNFGFNKTNPTQVGVLGGLPIPGLVFNIENTLASEAQYLAVTGHNGGSGIGAILMLTDKGAALDKKTLAIGWGQGTLGFYALTDAGAAVGTPFTVGIGVGNNVDINSTQYALSITSTTKGFVPPRMTTIQRDAIVSTTAGLVVYNTDNIRPEYWDSGTWYSMKGGPPYAGDDADTAGAPSFSWAVDTDTGMYNMGANRVGFSTAGTHRLEIAADGGVVVGAAVGGSQGHGTINATAYYDDGITPVPDYVFESYYDDADEYVVKPLDEEIKFTQVHKHLSTMSGRNDMVKTRKSLNAIIYQLWETIEIQFLYISELHNAVKQLSAG